MPRLLSRALLPLALALLAGAVFGFASGWAPGRFALALGGLGFTIGVAALAVRRVRAQVGLAAVSAIYTLAFGCLLLWSQSPALRYRIVSALEAPEAVGIWRTDERYGYSHVPNAIGVQEVPQSFRVTYRIDGEGCRETRTPRADADADVVLFLGGSITFGHGVEGDEAFPARLANRYWPDVKVRNRAVGGWGTAQAYLALQDDLRAGLRPRFVLYGWTPDHVRRNYIWRGWVESMAKYDRLHPWFELENDRLVYHGTIGPDQAVEENRETRNRASAITVRLITAMHYRARNAGAEFALIRLGGALSGKDGPSLGFSEHILRQVHEQGVRIIDARSARGTALPFDKHPAADWHAQVAGLLAGHPMLRQLLTLSPAASPP